MHTSLSSLVLNRNRRLIQFISILFLTVLLGCTLRAQTAHFSGAQSTVASAA